MHALATSPYDTRRAHLIEPSADRVRWAAHRMRDCDLREHLAQSFGDTRKDISDYYQAAFPTLQHGLWVIGHRGEPVAVGGGMLLWPNVASMWFFATDKWPQVAIYTTKFIMRVILPSFREAGVHRMEARSIEGHETAHRWLDRMGAKREAVLRQYGKGREDFHVYVWS